MIEFHRGIAIHTISVAFAVWGTGASRIGISKNQTVSASLKDKWCFDLRCWLLDAYRYTQFVSGYLERRNQLTNSGIKARIWSPGKLTGSEVKSRKAWYKSMAFHITKLSVRRWSGPHKKHIDLLGYIGSPHCFDLVDRVIYVGIAPPDNFVRTSNFSNTVNIPTQITRISRRILIARMLMTGRKRQRMRHIAHDQTRKFSVLSYSDLHVLYCTHSLEAASAKTSSSIPNKRT